MGRKRAKLDFKNEAREVVTLFKKERTLWKKERLQAIKLLLESDSSYVEISDVVGKSPSRIKEWAKQFREGGLDKLLSRNYSPGRTPKMSAAIEELLVEKLRVGSFRTAKQVLHWLKEEHQLEYGKDSIYYVLGKLGGRLKMPRPSHQKKDLEKVEAFRTTLAEQLLELELPKDKEISLWVYDEMRYGLHPLLRRMWSLIGTRVIAPVHRRFKWGYLFGAIEVEGSGSEFLYTEGLGKEFARRLLQKGGKVCLSDINIDNGEKTMTEFSEVYGKDFVTFKRYSRVHISSDTAFFKILKKPSIVQK